VGELSKTLFGTATEDDVARVRDKVNELISKDQDFDTLMQESIVCINEVQQNQAETTAKVNKLIAQMNSLQDHYTALLNYTTDISRTLYYVQVIDVIENGISYMESVYVQSREYNNVFQYRRDLAVIGHLTESLISSEKLDRTFKTLGISFPVEYLYLHASVTLVTLNPRVLGFHFDVPILSEELYSSWQISTVPFISGEHTHVIIPELYHVGMSLQSGQVIEIENCIYENPILCPSPVVFRELRCVQGILNRDARKIAECDVVSANEQTLRVKRISPDYLLIYSIGETLTERCESSSIATTVRLPAGT
jgi:uncharacterized FlaG/YvyC family protein